MRNPTLSVIMTNYNHSRFLPEALDAILTQSYTPMEFIIIDDASTDNSLEILEGYAKKYDFIKLYENKKNMGILHNANKLRGLASGDYVYGAAADDKIMPGFLEKSMDMLTEYPEAGLCSTLSYLIDADGNNVGFCPKESILKKSDFLPPEKVRILLKKYGSWIQGNTVVYKREALLDAGGHLPELYSYCDGFIVQVIALRHGVCFIAELLAAWRKMETGYASTQNRDPRRKHEIMKNACNLMETNYKDIFSKNYIDIWKKRQIYEILEAEIDKIGNQERQSYNHALELINNEYFEHDSLFFKIINLTIKIQKILIRLYLFYHLRSFSQWLRKKLICHCIK